MAAISRPAESLFGSIQQLGPIRSIPVNVLPKWWPMKSNEKQRKTDLTNEK